MRNTIINRTLGDVFRHAGVGLCSPDGVLVVASQPPLPTLRFHRWRDFAHLLIDPELCFAEAFANGHMTIEDGRIYDAILPLMAASGEPNTFRLAQTWRRVVAPFLSWAEGWTPKRSKANVHAHYDLGNDLYRLFLDQDLQYSCAYFAKPNASLEEAQQHKKQHIIAKLQLKPAMQCLDIGCGWGGLSFDLARAGGKVTGLTLSEEQFALAQSRQQHYGLDVDFLLQDYRHETRQFDRITSVGMFEHVGPAMFHRFFDQIDRNLKDDGVALIHTIGRPTKPQPVNRFITKYIFPGGYIPSLSQITKAIEKTDLLITDIECLYLHYAETLRHWRERFLTNRDKALALYDERFVRIWECYLAGCEAAFRAKQMTVFQIQLRKKNSPLPMTREYMYTPRKTHYG